MEKNEPIFKPIFGDSWNDLPPAMLKHYPNRPYSDNHATVEGHLDVMCKWFLKPFFWLFGTVPPHNEKNVPVIVHFKSEKNSADFCFDRIFHFKNRKPFRFKSKMSQVKDNEVVERMNYGICWHSYYTWDGEKVVLKHKGYSYRVFEFNIPLPITWIIGSGGAWEKPIDDNIFAMSATIDHWLLGKVYEYKGSFRIKEMK